MRNQCFDCGKFVAIGKGTTLRVVRNDGRPDMFYCGACADAIEQEKGMPFRKYFESKSYVDRVEVV